MELINATRMVAGFNMGLESSGREWLVVVVKGTFVLPAPGEPIRLADQQQPLVMADTFTGTPGFSAPVLEVDFALRKLACDVLLNGHARAPAGRPVTRLRAGLRVGPMTKTFDVVGNRVWQASLSGITASSPELFSEMPVSYDRAFGGVDRWSDDERDHDAYQPNPVGRGWHRHLKNAWVEGTPLPNLERCGQPVTLPDGDYTPMALGPLGRAWPARARWAGTYDDQWLADHFPFLPPDFNDRYHQAAPEDQQIPLPKGPLEVVLGGFTPDGPRQFTLPFLELPVQVFPRRGDREDLTATLDTVAFDTDRACVTMSWRVARPLRRSLHEISRVVVGRKGREWWSQREQLVINAPPAAMSPSLSVGTA